MERQAIIATLVLLHAVSLSALDRDLERRVDELVEPYVELGMFDGVVLIAHADEVLVHKGYGMASYEAGLPNGPETRFRIASISKQFTSLAIGKLIGEGRLSWTTRLSEVLPDFPNGDRISIEQLANHTSGLARLNDQPAYEMRMKVRVDLGTLVRWIGSLPLVFEPGTSERYSSGYTVLAYVVERVSGRGFADYLRSEILEPLGLWDTGHETTDGIYPGLAAGYVPGPTPRERRKAVYLAPDVKLGDGSLYSTALDLYRFAAGWHRHPLFDVESWDALVGPRERDGSTLTLYLQGRAPGYFSHVRKDHARGVIVVVLSNNYSWISWAAKLVELANGGDLSPPAYRVLDEPLSPREESVAAGLWEWPDGDRILLALEDGRLLYVHPTRGTRVAMPRLEGGGFLFRMFDLVCRLPETSAGAMSCTSHWHDETLDFRKVSEARP